MFRLTIQRRLRRKPRVFNTRVRARLQRSRSVDAIAQFSHELRTPLHGLSGTLELLGRSGLTGRQRQLVDAMQLCGRSLLSMLNGAIEIPGYYSSAARISDDQFDLADKIEDTIAMFLGWACNQSVELAYSISAAIPAVVSADGRRLQQVLNNLLSNSIKYAGGGTVMIEVSYQQQEPPMLQFRVSDSGNGIHHGMRHPDTGIYSSSGLGLDLSRALVRAAGGCMDISAGAGEGGCCSFTLPVTPAKSAAGINMPTSSLLQRRCVLVIVGDQARATVCCHLQRWGIPHMAQESVSRLQHSDLLHEGIDTVILDLPAGSADPYPQLRHIRQRWPTVPVAVLLPFASQPGDWEEMAALTVLHKPLTRRALSAWLIACSLRG